MAEKDIAPELFEQIQQKYESRISSKKLWGRPLTEYLDKAKVGALTLQDADVVAGELAEALTDSMCEVLTLENMPNEKMYYNIAEKTIGVHLQDNYKLVSNVTSYAIDGMYEDLGIGLKAKTITADKLKLNRIINDCSNSVTTTELHNVIRNSGGSFIRNAPADTKNTNAKFADKAGLKVLVTRIYDRVGLRRGTKHSEECSWCKERCGTDVPYAEAYAKGMFEKHEGCGCRIEYKVYKNNKLQRTDIL